MYSHETQVRVRYAETDQMGYLYYGNYAQYYEVGRVEMIRSLGLTYKKLEKEYGVMMPVIYLDMRFVRPAHYDELIKIRTTLRKMPDRFITFHVELFNEAGKLVNGGSVKLCFIEMSTNKSISVPPVLANPLRPFFEVENG